MTHSLDQNEVRLQWSPSQLQQLQQCKVELECIINGVDILARNACNVKVLKDEIVSLRNKLSEFDSDLFIVTTIGMLKAGKSTLVNLLARSCLASPTGFGFDTTLRPALITQTNDEKGKIQIWFKSDGGNASIESALDEVFAAVRGIIAKPTEAYLAEHPLSEENLKKALCQTPAETKDNTLPKEPLLVVIKVPRSGDALLSDKIAILDTPGLDSGISEWSQNKDNCYRWILRRSDLILFLQSSVAPLNETAAAILKEIKTNGRSAPIWLVHNVMEAKHWLTPENMDREIQEQRKMANSIFQKAVGNGFSSFQANLGKAYCSILKPDQAAESHKQLLLPESNFSSLESSVKESLNSSAGKIRKKNCCTQALKSVNAINNSLEALLDELRSKCSSLKKRKEEMGRIPNVFLESKAKKGVCDSFRAFDREKIDIEPVQWSNSESWERKLVEKIQAAFDDKKKYTAEDINTVIDQIANELAIEIHEKAKGLRITHIKLNSAGDGQSTGDVTQRLLEIFADYIGQIAQKDSSNGLADIYQNFQKNLPPFSESLELGLPSGLEGLRYVKNEKTWLFFDVKYDASHARNEARNSIKDSLKEFFFKCDEKLRSAVLRWINKTALSQLVDDFDAQLGIEVAGKLNELDKHICSVDELIAVIERVKTDSCKNLREYLEGIRQENE